MKSKTFIGIFTLEIEFTKCYDAYFPKHIITVHTTNNL